MTSCELSAKLFILYWDDGQIEVQAAHTIEDATHNAKSHYGEHIERWEEVETKIVNKGNRANIFLKSRLRR